MTGGLRRFVGVSAAVTTVDAGLLVLLRMGASWPVPLADAGAILAAAAVSYPLHREITFGDSPYARWVELPGAYVAVAVVAGAIDVGVVAGLSSMAGRPPGNVSELARVKVPALAAAAGFRAVAYRTVLAGDVQRDLADRRHHDPPIGTFRLSVVVPAYREADRIEATVRRLRADLAEVERAGGLEIVVVDDGSADGTAQAAWDGGADQVLEQPQNLGKGAALRAGVRASRGATVAFVDADLAYAPRQLLSLLAEVENGWDVAVGSRKHTQTKTLVRAGRLREVGGRAINFATHAVLLGRHRDTQCGIKAFRGDVGQRLFAATRIDGFAIDVELFHLVERYRLSLTEVPVEVENSARTTVKAGRDGLVLVSDLARIRRGGAQGWYREPVAHGSTRATTHPN